MPLFKFPPVKMLVHDLFLLVYPHYWEVFIIHNIPNVLQYLMVMICIYTQTRHLGRQKIFHFLSVFMIEKFQDDNTFVYTGTYMYVHLCKNYTIRDTCKQKHLNKWKICMYVQWTLSVHTCSVLYILHKVFCFIMARFYSLSTLSTVGMFYVIVDGKEGWIPSDILRISSRRSSVSSSYSRPSRSRSVSPSPMHSRSPSPMDMSEMDRKFIATPNARFVFNQEASSLP